ncbi:MAG: hypothetical protein KUG82_17170 [Pseudomonadales bacterium]|nr:hypothetical protein [Pseudomonadales bacterium]
MRAKFLIVVLLTVLFSVGCVIFFSDPGYVLLSYGNRVLETSLLFFLIVEGIMLVLGIVGWSLWRYVMGPKFGLQIWLASRGNKKAQKNATQGLIQLAEGNWLDAQRLLSQSAANAQNPFPLYIGAARAANYQGDAQQRDELLQLAADCIEGADVALSLIKAEMQCESKQWQSAMATLIPLSGTELENSSAHPAVLKLLDQIYRELNDWDSLQKLLPKLKKSKVLSKLDFANLEKKVYSQVLYRHLQSSNHSPKLKTTKLAATWDSLPEDLKKDVYMIEVYCQLLMKLEDEGSAETLIRHTLTQGQWSDKLVNLYGCVKSDDIERQLATIEKWNRQRPDNAEIALALGRITLQKGNSTQALEFFETSLALIPSMDVYRELARWYHEFGDAEKSYEYLQRSLTLVSVALPELPNTVDLLKNISLSDTPTA